MENVLLINRIEDIKLLTDKYSRVYLGNEFCSRLLPTESEIKKILAVVKKEKLKLTIVTSFAGEDELKKIKKFFSIVNKHEMLDEVVVNDYGILNLLINKYPKVKLVAGRALSRFYNFDKKNYLYDKIGIRRFEFDSNRINEDALKNISSVKFSYYHPYSILNTTRYCSVVDKKNKSSNIGILKCNQECQKIGSLKLKNKLIRNKLTLRGNAIFINNKEDKLKVIKNIKAIDRLVFQN